MAGSRWSSVVRLQRAGVIVALVMALPGDLTRTAHALCNLEFDGAVFSVVGLKNAADVAVSPDGAHVYVAGQKGAGNKGAVAAFSRNPAPCGVTSIQAQVDEEGVMGIGGASAVAVSPDGRYVYVAGRSDDAVAVFDRQTDPADPNYGKLTFRCKIEDGPDPTDGLDDPQSIAVSPDSSHVYVASSGDDDAVAVLREPPCPDPGCCAVFVEAKKDVQSPLYGLQGAKGVAVSPGGGHVYVVASREDAVTGFERNPLTGALSWIQTVRRNHPYIPLGGAAAVAVSADGAYVYVAAAGDDAVAVFRRDATTGMLTDTAMHPSSAPSDVIANPDGVHVHVAQPSANAVSAYRHSWSGGLTFDGTVVDNSASVYGLKGATAIAASPDNRCLYVAARISDALAYLHTFQEAGTPCSDGNVCTDADVCDGNGECVGTPQPGAPCNDGNSCTNDVCAGNGECVGTPQPGAPCDDGNFCTNDVCDAAGACVGTCMIGAACPGCPNLTCQLSNAFCFCLP